MSKSMRRLAAVLAALVFFVVWGGGSWLISEAYDGRGPGFLVRKIAERRDSLPLDYYLGRVRFLAVVGALGVGAAALAIHTLLRDARAGSPLARRVIAPASPTSLAGIRIGVCSVTLISVLLEDPASTASLPGFSALPRGLASMGFLKQLPGLSTLFASASWLYALKVGCVIALIAGLLGLYTRLALFLALGSALLIGGGLRMYTHFFHSGLLPLYVLGVLALSPCADALSLDVLRRARRGESIPTAEGASLRYGFARFTCWAVIGLTYFAAGTSKLRHGGLGWWDGVNLKAKILSDALQVGSFDFPFLPVLEATPLFVFSLMGLATLVIELGMLLVPFSALARLVLPLGVMGLHLGIFLAQEILFLDLILIQTIFFDYRRIARPAYVWLTAHYQRLLMRAGTPKGAITRDAPGTSLGLVLIPIVYAAVIALNVELYPLTTWSMYSDRTRSTVVEYILLHGRDASGNAVPVRLEEAFGVFRLSRDFDVIPLAFKPEARADLERTLDAYALAYNAQREPAQRLVSVHFERRSLDFTRQRLRPTEGEVVDRLTYETRTQ